MTTSSSSRSPKACRISFAESPTVHSIPCARDSMSSQELDSVWYSQHELNLILQECQVAVALLPESVGTTMRGLELMTPEGFSLFTIRDKLVQQVLKEQARLQQQHQEQKQDENDVSEALADFQRQNSTHRQRIAHLRGLSDAQAADVIITKVPFRRISNPDRRRARSERLRPSPEGLSGSNRSLN